MTKIFQSALLGAIVLLSFSPAFCAEAEKAIGEKDGLQLIISKVAVPDLLQPAFECRLHNISDEDIPFDLSTHDYRLSFRAIDARGKDIPMTSEGDREYDWRRVEHMRHSSATIEPGEDRVFTFHPVRAYGERWKSAAHLIVSWEPGIDWSTEKPYTKGRGLTVSYEIPKDGGTSNLDEQTKGSAASEPSPSGSQDIDLIKAKKKLGSHPAEDPLRVEQPSTTSWSILVVLAVAVVAVVWLMFKKRSSPKN